MAQGSKKRSNFKTPKKRASASYPFRDKIDDPEFPRTDPEVEHVWQCPDCRSFAALALNAQAHRWATGHAKPFQAPFPDPAIVDLVTEAGFMAIKAIEEEASRLMRIGLVVTDEDSPERDKLFITKAALDEIAEEIGRFAKVRERACRIQAEGVPSDANSPHR